MIWEVCAVGSIIAVLSGKGGTGKTSVCAGVAIALAEAGATVLCIDCDVGLRNLDISLGMSDNGTLSFLDVLRGGYPLEQAPRHSSYPSLAFLTAPVNVSADEIDVDAFTRLLYTARSRFDYILLDAPAGLDSGFRLAAVPADRCILVTGAAPAAVRDAARVGDVLEIMGKKDVRLVVNRVDKAIFTSMKLTVDDIMDTAGLPLLGIVPEDHNVVLAAAFGEPLPKYKKRSPAAVSYRNISKRIQGMPVPITLR
jgi:septum site-determining protein MinD